MRICHLSASDERFTGAALHELQSLKSAGYDVTVISRPGTPALRLEAAGIRHLPLTGGAGVFRGPEYGFSFWSMYRLLCRERFTIVHTHGCTAGRLGPPAARMAGVPIIIMSPGRLDRAQPAAWLWKGFEKIAVFRPDLILWRTAPEPGQASQNCAVERLSRGIDLRRFDPARFDEGEVLDGKRKVGIAGEVPVVGFVGRLAARRTGFLDFLAAARHIARCQPAVKFLIAGNPRRGRADAVEPSTAAEYGIGGHCVFLGNRDNAQLPLFYKMMNVVVVPSAFESAPRVIMEAAAMGTPSVASDLPDHRQAVGDGKAGLLTGPGDVAGVARAVLRILGEPPLAQELSRQARVLARECFDERLVFEKLQILYASLAARLP